MPGNNDLFERLHTVKDGELCAEDCGQKGHETKRLRCYERAGAQQHVQQGQDGGRHQRWKDVEVAVVGETPVAERARVGGGFHQRIGKRCGREGAHEAKQSAEPRAIHQPASQT